MPFCNGLCVFFVLCIDGLGSAILKSTYAAKYLSYCYPPSESSELEVVRLKRRVKELEQAYKSLSTLNGNTAVGGTGTKSGK